MSVRGDSGRPRIFYTTPAQKAEFRETANAGFQNVDTASAVVQQPTMCNSGISLFDTRH